MTPEQKIKWAIVNLCSQWNNQEPPEYPNSNIDEIYDTLAEEGEGSDYDAIAELREGYVETDIPSEYSRHYYESKSVAMNFPDGSWVGWTYWYGGGKYGEPEAIEWISEAYDLNCVEEEKVVKVRTFTKEPK